jgi:hypothetical protein
MGKHLFYDSWWKIIQYRDGKEIWSMDKKNSLVDEGEEAMLESFFRGSSTFTPTQFYIRLCNDTLTETDTLVSIQGEPTTNGYAAQLVERSTVGFPTKDMPDGDYRITSKELTFTAAGGNIGPVTTAYLATTSDNTGKFIAFVDLAMTRTILSGDSMVVQIRIKLQ